MWVVILMQAASTSRFIGSVGSAIVGGALGLGVGACCYGDNGSVGSDGVEQPINKMQDLNQIGGKIFSLSK